MVRFSICAMAVLVCLSERGVYCNPLERRQATTTSAPTSNSSSSASSSTKTSPAPRTAEWVTILPNGSGSTVTPHVTVVNGQTSTADLMPTSDSSTSVANAASSTSSDSSASASVTSSPSSEPQSVMRCASQLPGFEPICSPANGSEVYYGQTFYWTWDSTALPSNSTVTIVLNYADPFPMAGTQAIEASAPNAQGYLTITMDQAWLHGLVRNNISSTLVSAVTGGPPAIQYRGPVVSLTAPPAEHLPVSTGTGINKKGLEIGLPVVIAFVVVCLFGACWWNRKTRTIGPVKWRKRNLGYATRQSGRQRMGIGKKGVDAKIRERELVDGEREGGGGGNGYSDEPFAVGESDRIDGPWQLNDRGRQVGAGNGLGHGHGRDASLGSLVGDDVEMNDFRKEIGRQETERR